VTSRQAGKREHGDALACQYLAERGAGCCVNPPMSGP
jgi:hypothetical protein